MAKITIKENNFATHRKAHQIITESYSSGDETRDFCTLKWLKDKRDYGYYSPDMKTLRDKDFVKETQIYKKSNEYYKLVIKQFNVSFYAESGTDSKWSFIDETTQQRNMKAIVLFHDQFSTSYNSNRLNTPPYEEEDYVDPLYTPITGDMDDSHGVHYLQFNNMVLHIWKIHRDGAEPDLGAKKIAVILALPNMYFMKYNNKNFDILGSSYNQYKLDNASATIGSSTNNNVSKSFGTYYDTFKSINDFNYETLINFKWFIKIPIFDLEDTETEINIGNKLITNQPHWTAEDQVITIDKVTCSIAYDKLSTISNPEDYIIE